MDINDRVYVAKKDPTEREKLIKEYTPFVIKQLSQMTNKYIDERNSDELSIGLLAFNEAIDNYDNTKGSFLSFSSMLIKRRLIDFFRKNHTETIPLELYIESGEDYESENRKLEMFSFVSLLSLYNITLDDLVKQSPKHSDTRKTAVKIAYTICENSELLAFLKTKKTLPVKELVHILNISRKTIEKHRKYIIALVIILSEDLPILKQYISSESEVAKI
ncbi:RNA polymerase sigma factor SigI [Thermoanaerobacter kivui]|uniref:RNA polymerase sigma factor SigI n=1 Tax=Thermoanaerobacter kivui TaxID=2325 RepID=A0A097AND2_THEKI|nr:RNA polymerase sigma factor SigI [Thermoanaerobacter kivui]AIS51324.1 RNA polymerase sigma factor SigI [Thermoanaerobacter kivui]